jgi:hemolysin III
LGFLDFREPVSAWTHCLWMLLALPGTLFLWRLGRGDRPKQISLLLFGLSLVACYGGSTLYHSVRLPQADIDLCERLDHVGIYILIAGSYTPVAFTMLQGRWKWGSLSLVWLLAAGGIGLRCAFWDIPAWLYTGLYLVMGWGAVLCYFELARAVSHRALFPLVLGGVFYSVGALLNLAQWPILWPDVVGAHELFHLFVMAGSLTHFGFMVQWVVPFERAGGGRSVAEAAEPEVAAVGSGLEPGRVGS